MSKHIIYSALALCLIASCKKSDEKKLIGKWRGVAEVSDENNNGVLDAQEQQKGTSSGTDPYWGYIFKKGGDAEVIEQLSNPCKWELKNNGDILKMTSSVHGGWRDFKVLKLSNTDMILEYVENENEPPQWQQKSWHVLKKQ